MPWEQVPTDELASNPRHWALEPGARWHGFAHVGEHYAMTDPNKLTLLTPGFDRATGEYDSFGIPGPVVAQFLRENRVVPEKNDLNSLLFLADARRGIQQGRYAVEHARRVQAAL